MITVAVICPCSSPECVNVQHFEGRYRKFFWSPRPYPNWTGRYSLHSTDPTIFNKFTHMDSCHVFLYAVI